MDAVIVSLAESPWVLAAVFLVVVLDGFFPPVPSETVVVALAAVGAATGAPNPGLVLLVAGLGSFLGDNIAFSIGRRVGSNRFRSLRGKKVGALMERARSNLDRRAASVILTARFVPGGRVVVNVLAGASSFPRHRFVAFSAVSGVLWAAYSVLIGVVAGAWVHDTPLLGAGIAVIIALVSGLVVDRISHSRTRRSVKPASSAGSDVTLADGSW
ncbi:DedA family protein [Frigoribacterium sp. VKM Ac-2530]|uniref:DedA family protein n=1 Tax=Frigoribacterium sp. VKM Ac-2530 TaxID=2783822 RepID=UPI00188C71FD|nr:DedA family protein [Frigoribacterium sp. VKM Ac-2530]